MVCHFAHLTLIYGIYMPVIHDLDLWSITYIFQYNTRNYEHNYAKLK